MKKKIVILGSTGSIGNSLLNILNKDIKNYEIILLSAQKNYKKLLQQAKKFNVKNIIINDPKYFKLAKNQKNLPKIKIYNNFEDLDEIIKKKIDYTMISITGIDGLDPTLKLIKHSKKIAIANKESIICGWNLIKKKLKKYKTEFLPVDSEHFSIWYALKKNYLNNIEKIYLTASGGPLMNLPLKKFKNVKVKLALKHPNWKMGKKISIDSATMMNKVFEVIEAKNIFNISYKKLDILVHPSSYLHAIVKFNNGLIKIIAHDTTMKIPIFNTLYSDTIKKLDTSQLSIQKLNNLNLSKVDLKKFPLVKLISKLPINPSLFETVIVSANDELVNLFLEKKIKFTDISSKLYNLIRIPEFKKYKKLQPNNLRTIIRINKYVRSKIRSMCV